MSLYKDASLVMIPSAYKDGKLYSIRPTDGSGDFTFSRGSNLAATRVDVNGLIEKGRENLLPYSNQFNQWSDNAGVTETGGQSGYDGTNDAWKITLTSNSGSVRELVTHNGVYTLSLYAKAGNKNWLALYLAGTPTPYVYFDLANGVLGSNVGNNAITSKIEDAGGGWYRCSVIYNANITGTTRIFPADSNGVLAYANDYIYIQDAQLEQGLVATDYIETGASTAQAGILEDLPRLDYSGGASCPALLLEPQRLNYIPQSEPFNGGDWLVSSSAAIVSNATISPEGLQNAAEVQGPSGSSFIYDVLNLTASTTHTTSFYIKNNNSTRTQFFAANESTYSINWDGLTIDSVDSGVYYESVGNNWYRVWSTQDSNSDGQFITRFYPSNAGASVYLYGYQVEAGSYPTSYIPTYGSAVTRSGEYIYNTTTNFKTEGILGSTWTFMYDQTFVNVARDAASSVFLIDNGNGGDGLTNVRISLNSNGSFRLQDSDGTQLGTGGNKILCRYDGSTIAWFIDGSLLNSHSVTDADFANLDRYNPSQNNKKKVILNQILIFPTALTDSECIALTTL
jgi:hypothetical protein